MAEMNLPTMIETGGGFGGIQRAQNNLTAQLQQQTLYLISQLKTTTTPAAGA